jgi:hypothetical protein
MPARVVGGLALRRALKKFEPDLAKETSKEIASFVKPIAVKARGFLPSNEEAPSGWLKRDNAQGRWATRYYDKSEASRGISYKTTPSRKNSRGFVALASVTNKSIGGVIYEWAGRTSGINGNFTPKLESVSKLAGRTKGLTGRGIFKAFAEDNGKATAGVLRAIEKSAAKFNAGKAKV